MEHRAQGEFRLGVAASDAGHDFNVLFRGVTATRKNVFLTFLTTHGIAPNAYAKELVPVELTTDCLFEEVS